MKRKSIAVLLAVFTLALSACGSSADQSEVNGKVVQKNTESSQSSQSDSGSSETAADADSDDASDEDEGFSIGSNSGSYYENTFFGIRYTPSNGMELQDEAYIEQINSLASDMISDEEMKKTLESGTSVTVAASTNADSTMTFNIGIQNMESVFDKVVTEDFIIDSSLDQVKQMIDSMGVFESVEVTKDTATMLGEEHPCICVKASAGDITFAQKSVVIRKGSYAATFTAGGYSEDAPQQILDDITEI